MGCFVARAGAPVRPMILGGGQEQERRSGTENIAGVVGLATALGIAIQEREEFVRRAREMKGQLLSGLRSAFDDRLVVNSPEDATPHIVHVSLLGSEGAGLDREMLMLGLDIDGLAVSAGSACSSGTMSLSHVLTAIGKEDAVARGAIRCSFGPQTSPADVDQAVRAIVSVGRRMGA